MTPLEALSRDLARDIEDTRAAILEQIAWLENDLTETVQRLHAGQSVNALGYCQKGAREIDRLCAVLDERTKALQRLQDAIKGTTNDKENGR
jgi:hypothetical protein